MYLNTETGIGSGSVNLQNPLDEEETIFEKSPGTEISFTDL